MKNMSAFIRELSATSGRGNVEERSTGLGMVRVISFLLRYLGQLPD